MRTSTEIFSASDVFLSLKIPVAAIYRMCLSSLKFLTARFFDAKVKKKRLKNLRLNPIFQFFAPYFLGYGGEYYISLSLTFVNELNIFKEDTTSEQGRRATNRWWDMNLATFLPK